MKSTRGAALVELAMICPVLMFLIIGGIDIGFAMLDKIELEFAAEASARCRAMGNLSCASPADTAVYAASLVSSAPGISAANFSVSAAACGSLVTANYTYAPMFVPSAFSLTAKACYP